MKINILSLLNLNDEQKNRIRSASNNINVNFSSYEDVSVDDVKNTHMIFGNIAPDMLPYANELKLLQIPFAGADVYTKPGVLPEGVVLVNATGAYGVAVSEHAFATLLMFQKNLHLYRDYQNKHEWKKGGFVKELSNQTVVITGLGDIGLGFARLVKMMGAYVIGIKRRKSEKPEYVDELILTDEVNDALGRADVVFNVMPHTPDTEKYFDDDKFSKMKDGCFFINCGRGTSVDQESLIRHLESGKLSGASLDVMTPEPLPADSKLWDMENVIITPHIAGEDHLPSTLDKIVDIAIYNLKALENNTEFKNIIDMSTGYVK